MQTEAERQDIIRYVEKHPKDGRLMEGTGGVCRLRWRRGGQRKSGGVHVINEAMPLYLLTLFAKGRPAPI